MEDTLAESCIETLRLLEFYGPKGSRLQDPRVGAMVAGDTPAIYTAKSITSLIGLLQEIDRVWLKKHSDVDIP